MSLSAIASNVDRMETRLDGADAGLPVGADGRVQRAGAVRAADRQRPAVPQRDRGPVPGARAAPQVWLLPGSMFERVGNTIYNTASVIDPAGNVVGRYRKMFPFYPYEEGVDRRRRVPGLRRARGRPLRGLDLLRHVVPRDLADARGDGRRGHPPPDPDLEHRSRGRARDRPGDRGPEPVLLLRRQRPRRRRHRRSIVVGPHGDVLHRWPAARRCFRSRSTSAACAAAARSGSAGWASRSRASATAA